MPTDARALHETGVSRARPSSLAHSLSLPGCVSVHLRRAWGVYAVSYALTAGWVEGLHNDAETRSCAWLGGVDLSLLRRSRDPAPVATRGACPRERPALLWMLPCPVPSLVAALTATYLARSRCLWHTDCINSAGAARTPRAAPRPLHPPRATHGLRPNGDLLMVTDLFTRAARAAHGSPLTENRGTLACRACFLRCFSVNGAPHGRLGAS